MSKAEDRLRAAGFFNPHMISTWAGRNGLPDVWVQYYATQTGRMYRSAAWRVHRPDRATDPTAHWMDHGAKTFTVSKLGDRAGAKSAALGWASERYGIEEWVTIPGVPFTLFPKDVAVAMRRHLKSIQ